ncbi:MAG: sodium:solute symporter family protein, partial [Bacteroidota bacterium]
MDLTILGIFLVATLIVGLSYGRQVKTIQDYALGGQNFSTYTLVATIIATFASGSGFFIHTQNTYMKGFYHMTPFLGVPVELWLQGRLAIRMGEFMNHVSIAEAMGSMYGKTVQLITAFSSILARVGYIAIQFKIIAKVIVMLFGINSELATMIATSIVILYSAFGGIKSVTFTDVLQFFTFGTVLPILALVMWRSIKNPAEAVGTLTSNSAFDFQQLTSWNVTSLSILGLFLYYATPTMQPELFQRISMAKDVRQARRVLTYSAGGLLLVYLIAYWIGMLILVDNPGLEKTEVVPYMVKQYTSSGLLGLLGAGIVAMAMSTADSSLNSISVMFAHDFVRPLTGQKESSVMHARLFSVVAGSSALFMALYNQDLLKLVLLSVAFYKPIFVIPFLMAVLGFRTSSRAVLLSMVAGAITVAICQTFFTAVPSVI